MESSSHVDHFGISRFTLASFDPKGPTSSSISGLMWLMVILGLAIYVVFVSVLFRGLRSPKSSSIDNNEDNNNNFGTNGKVQDAEPDTFERRWLVIAGLFIPTVILAIIFVFTLRTMNAVAEKAPDGSLVVEVTGHRWWWEVSYPSDGFTTGFSTTNEVHIPSGQPVTIRLSSADVIHSFWIPELGGKVDAFPDYPNELVIEANEPGNYQGSCAEFCGLHHARMPVKVIAHTQKQFDEWLAGQRQAAQPVQTSSQMTGREIFRESGCADCHAVVESAGLEPRTKGGGPDLTHQASRPMLLSLRRERTREMLATWITDPESVKSKSGMPPTKLDAQQLRALIDYLEHLR